MKFIKNYYSEYRDKDNKLLLFLSIDIVEEKFEFSNENLEYLQCYIEIGCPIIFIKEHFELEKSLKLFSDKISNLGFVSANKQYVFDAEIELIFQNIFKLLKCEAITKNLTIPDFLLMDDGNFNRVYFDFLVANSYEDRWGELIRKVELNKFVSTKVNSWIYSIYMHYYDVLIDKAELNEVPFKNVLEQFKDESCIVDNLIEIYKPNLKVYESIENKCFLIMADGIKKPIAIINI